MKLVTTYIMGAIFGAGLLYLFIQYGPLAGLLPGSSPMYKNQHVASNDRPEVKGESISVTPVSTLTLTPDEKKDQAEKYFIEENMQKMNIKEKIGQMFMWQVSEKKLSKETEELIVKTNAGGVILMGNRTISDLSNITTDLKELDVQQPLFIAIDQEGGEVKRLIEDPNPGPPELGDMKEEKFCKTIKNTSDLLWENGVNLNFGIVADVGWYKDSFIKDRTFSSKVDVVSEKVEQALDCNTNVLTTVKHFPGHGRTKLDTHVTVPEIKIDYEKWEDTDAKPFKVAIENGVDFVMMGHLIYSKIASEPASLSKEHIQKVRDMGFEGVITTDDLGMLEASDHDAYESLDKAINSGIDMMLYVRTEENSEDLYQHAVESMIKDKKMENRINESVKRILKMKFQLLGEEKVNDQSKD